MAAQRVTEVHETPAGIHPPHGLDLPAAYPWSTGCHAARALGRSIATVSCPTDWPPASPALTAKAGDEKPARTEAVVIALLAHEPPAMHHILPGQA